MPPVHTREAATQYLAQIFPSHPEWRIYQFTHGWVCRTILTPEQIAASQDLGLTALVIDSETGVVIEYPSWSIEMVAEDYSRTKQTGQPPTGGQIYPYRQRVSIHRTQENPDTVQYQVRIESLTQPPEPTTEYQVTIDKNTLAYQPTDSTSATVVSTAEWRHSQNGTWPDQEIFEQ
jgi:hypothetical protein